MQFQPHTSAILICDLIMYLAKSLPAVISWLNDAFLMLFVSKGSKTESMMNTIYEEDYELHDEEDDDEEEGFDG